MAKENHPGTANENEAPLICIVDGDKLVRERIHSLVTSAGFRARPFESAESFLSANLYNVACLVLDCQLPGMGGLQLQRFLIMMHRPAPSVFVTERADQFRVQALSQGAVEVLGKPFTDEDLLRAIRLALPPSGIL